MPMTPTSGLVPSCASPVLPESVLPDAQPLAWRSFAHGLALSIGLVETPNTGSGVVAGLSGFRLITAETGGLLTGLQNLDSLPLSSPTCLLLSQEMNINLVKNLFEIGKNMCQPFPVRRVCGRVEECAPVSLCRCPEGGSLPRSL